MVMLVFTPQNFVEAVTQVVYPDNSALVPLPENVYPDLSHSVQSSRQVAPEILEQNPDILTTPSLNEVQAQKKSSPLLAFIAVGFLILTFGIAIVRRHLWKKTMTNVNQE